MASARKSLLLRLDPAVHDALTRWAGDELRSTNAQIEFLLRRALTESGRSPGSVPPIRRPGRPAATRTVADESGPAHASPSEQDDTTMRTLPARARVKRAIVTNGPQSLPSRMFLLAIDLDRERPTQTSILGQLMRSSALTELLLSKRLIDEGGKPRLATTQKPSDVHDPLLRAVLEQIDESSPKSWKRWVNAESKAARAMVREQLESGRVIRVEPRRILGIVPAERIVVADRRAAKALATYTARDLTGSQPVASLEPLDAAAAALAAVAQLNPVCSGKQRRDARQRIKQLIERGGPAVRALKSVVDDNASASAAV